MSFRFVSDTGKAAIVLTLLLSASLTHGQDPNAAGSPAATDESMSSYQAINASVDTILQQYEQLTGKVIIKDSNLTANAAPITISVLQPVPKSELVRLIEASLLLNNFALIPSQEPNTVKVININAGKNPRSEGVRLFTGPESIPEGEQIISYYMPFRYISANEALTVFQTHILPRAFTSFVPINSAQALLITETTSVIRQLISLQQLIDAPPAKVVSEFIQLVRADAERVAETINKLLETQRKDQGGGGGNPQQPGVVQPGVGAEAGILTTQAQLVPDTRTNRILLVTRPANVDYYKTLIKQFDLAVTAAKPLEYRLRYISAGDVLPVLQDFLSEGQQAQGPTGTQAQPQQTRSVNINQPRAGSTTTGAGGYSPVSGSAGSVGAGQDLLQEPNEQLAPQAVVVGKTRIISDPKDNNILVIGPPENLQKVRTILDRLDRRPQQVYLSTVIAQLTLTNDSALGVDWTQTFKKISGGSGIASSNLNSAGILSNGSGGAGASVLNPRELLHPSNLPSLQGLTIYGTIGDAVSYFIRATDSYGKTKILGRPAVYTANNKRAVIASGQRVPVPGQTLSNLTTGTTGGIINNSSSTAVAATVNYEDVELRLEVIPLINSNNEVTLKVAQINDTLGNTVNISGNQVPEVNSQRLTTTVTVPSGATVVLGGLIKETISDTNNGIPYLDRIPYLGHLFKYSTKSKERDELLVFISPTVVNDDAQTFRASIKEERRTQAGPEAYPLAHPSDYSGAPPQPVRKKGK
jgi:general secretion pathway protein D